MNAAPPIDGATDDDALLRAAAALAWRDDHAAVSLPTVLTRPPLEGAVGMLDYSEPEDPNSAAWPRWNITGSSHAIIMAKKLFGTDSMASDGGGKSISFPATLGSFDELLMEAEAIRQTRRATALAKLPAVIAFLRGLMEAEEPTLCFLHHHAVTDGILEALEEFRPVCITGRQDKSQKDEAVTAFSRGDTNLCLISLRTATGIDGLQARARVVVFAELDWSPAVHRQAEDRAHRMGQRDSVLAYYLVTDLGTDPFVMMTLNLKASQFTGLMQDRGESDDDRRDAKDAAKQHMEGVLSMLRGRK